MKRVIQFTLAAAMLIAPRVFAAEAPAAAPAPLVTPSPATAKASVDPKAEEVIKKSVAWYKSVNSATATVDTKMKMEMGPQKQEMNSSADIAVERPNKLGIRVTESARGGGTVVSDGSKLYMHVPQFKKYSEQTAPKSLDQILDSPAAFVGQFANIVLVLFTDDPYPKIMDGVTKVAYLGQEDIEGKKHDHVRFEQDALDMDVWFEASETPFIRRIKPDPTRQLAQAGQQLQGMKMDGLIEVKDWKQNQPVAADKFQFTAPKEGTKVNSMQEIFPGAGGVAAPQEPTAAPAGPSGPPAPAAEPKPAPEAAPKPQLSPSDIK